MREKRKREIKDMTEEEAALEWDRGEDLDLGATPERHMSIFTLRLDSVTFKGLVELGQREGKGTTVIAREILQEGVRERQDRTFDYEVLNELGNATAKTMQLLEQRGYSVPYTSASFNTMNLTGKRSALYQVVSGNLDSLEGVK